MTVVALVTGLELMSLHGDSGVTPFATAILVDAELVHPWPWQQTISVVVKPTLETRTP